MLRWFHTKRFGYQASFQIYFCISGIENMKITIIINYKCSNDLPLNIPPVHIYTPFLSIVSIYCNLDKYIVDREWLNFSGVTISYILISSLPLRAFENDCNYLLVSTIPNGKKMTIGMKFASN